MKNRLFGTLEKREFWVEWSSFIENKYLSFELLGHSTNRLFAIYPTLPAQSYAWASVQINQLKGGFI